MGVDNMAMTFLVVMECAKVKGGGYVPLFSNIPQNSGGGDNACGYSGEMVGWRRL